jgi:hypothetical protein
VEKIKRIACTGFVKIAREEALGRLMLHSNITVGF